MTKTIPKLVYSEFENNKPFNIYHLLYISINDKGICPRLFFYLDNGDYIEWKFPDKEERSKALSELYKLTNAVKI